MKKLDLQIGTLLYYASYHVSSIYEVVYLYESGHVDIKNVITDCLHRTLPITYIEKDFRLALKAEVVIYG